MVAVKTWRLVVGTDKKTVEDLNRVSTTSNAKSHSFILFFSDSSESLKYGIN